MSAARPSTRRAVLAGLGALAALPLARAGADEVPIIRLGTLAGGTAGWEAEVIRARGLDMAESFSLETSVLAGTPATQIALQGGAVDAIVTDWVWAAGARASGLDLVLIPYSTAVGGMMVAGNSEAHSLSDLRGQRIAVAGGPLDKSWLILRALGLTQGIDLAAETEAVFAAPPLVMQAALSGEVAAAVNYWHLLARMRAAGMRDLVTVRQAQTALGLDPDVPLLAYAVRRDRVFPQHIARLARASRAAKTLLAQDDGLWNELRPLMGAASEAEFIALRDGYRAGIPPDRPADPAAAGALLDLLKRSGGEGPDRVPPGLFFTDG